MAVALAGGVEVAAAVDAGVPLALALARAGSREAVADDVPDGVPDGAACDGDAVGDGGEEGDALGAARVGEAVAGRVAAADTDGVAVVAALCDGVAAAEAPVLGDGDADAERDAAIMPTPDGAKATPRNSAYAGAVASVATARSPAALPPEGTARYSDVAEAAYSTNAGPPLPPPAASTRPHSERTAAPSEPRSQSPAADHGAVGAAASGRA